MVRLNKDNFPDANFRKGLAWIFGIKEGDEITDEMISKTTSLNVGFCGIEDLRGIEHFTELKELWCYNNKLTSLDVSKNTMLEYLYCQDNQLTSLNVSGCPELKTLCCGWNRLTTLDVSGNKLLVNLDCNHNQLTSLDMSKNTALKFLCCQDNQLTELLKNV